ncbi:MAG: hypothetical protein R6X13_03315, partial [bacterium]
LRHLFIAGEALGPKLLTLHNVWFYQRLVQGIRTAIELGRFEQYSADFLGRYGAQSGPAEQAEGKPGQAQEE